MNINYDDISIGADDLIPSLEAYAKSILSKMQKADPDCADCWTACSITFDGLQPEFAWGSIQDIKGSEGIYIEQPQQD